MTQSEFEHIAKQLRSQMLKVALDFFGLQDDAEDVAVVSPTSPRLVVRMSMASAPLLTRSSRWQIYNIVNIVHTF